MHPTELTAPPRVDEGVTARTLAKCGTRDAKSVLGPSTFAVRCLPMSMADPLTAAFRSAQDGEGLPQEFAHFRATGRGDFEILDGAAARRGEPALADEMCRAIRFQGVRYIDPARYIRAIAGSTCARGGRIVERTKVRYTHATRSGVTVAGEEYDSVVLAHGAWTNRLARRAGVRQIVRSGRGYTFTVKMDRLPEGPGCFPRQMVACTPRGDPVRIAGTMDFRDVSAPKDPRRIQSHVAQAGTLLKARASTAARTKGSVPAPAPRTASP